jgi:transposase-like protein
MSGRKGMLHYKVEIKQEAVRLVLEEHLTYAAVAVLFSNIETQGCSITS